jgi:hypothetical protein
MYANAGALRMLGECSTLKMPSQDVVIWNAIILGHTKCGQENKAQELF